MTLLERLIKLRDEGPKYFNVGICHNTLFDIWTDEEYNQYLTIVKTWPKWSGNPYFPVPHPTKGPHVAFNRGLENIWIGEYGQNRKELLDFLIQGFST